MDSEQPQNNDIQAEEKQPEANEKIIDAAIILQIQND